MSTRRHGAPRRARVSTLAAFLLIAMTGCSSTHQPAAATETAAADAVATDIAAPDTAAPDAATTATEAPADGSIATAVPDSTAQSGDAATAAPDSPGATAEDTTGVGHVSLTGQYSLEKDFKVSGCQVGPPGDGLLSGYHMTSGEGADPIALLAVALKEYDKDASYVQANPSRAAAAGRAMTSGFMGALTLMVMQGAASPLAFGQVPGSKLTITVSDDGAKGDAEFTGLESQPSMADFDAKSGTMPKGKDVSGSVTWTCGSVGRITAKTSDTVDGAFHALLRR